MTSLSIWRGSRLPSASLAALLSLPLAAQTHFAELHREHTPREVEAHRAVATGDVDRDGDIDLVFGLHPGVPRLYRNDGHAVFETDVTGMAGWADAQSLTLVDVDGDGDLDMFITQWSAAPLLWIQVATELFGDETAARLPPWGQNQWVEVVLSFDVDGDGDTDLLIPGRERLLLYINDGQGNFSNQSTRLPNLRTETKDAEAVDVDGDGDLDVVLARASVQINSHYLLLNDGQGNFSDASAARMPATTDYASSVASGDVDGDGDPDLVFGGNGLELYTNSGGGNFRSVAPTALPLPNERRRIYQATDLADVDGDGDLDLLTTTTTWGRHLLLNDGTGNFVPAPQGDLPQERVFTFDQVVADLDGDGDVDLAQANSTDNAYLGHESGINSILLNDGGGGFRDGAGTAMVAYDDETTAILPTDLTGDGIPELVVAWVYGSFSPSAFVHVHRNDGSPEFTEMAPINLPESGGKVTALAAGDVNGDRAVDLFVGREGPDDTLFFGDGTGTLTLAPAGSFPYGSEWTMDATLFDMDSDGDLDLVTAQQRIGGGGAVNRLYRNDGRGVFIDVTTTRMLGIADTTSSVATFDPDGDGDLDVVFGGNGGNTDDVLWINDGTGSFVDESFLRLPSPMGYSSLDVDVGDLDGDGSEDLLFATTHNGARIYLNNGFGFFVDVSSRMPLSLPSCSRAAFTDADFDGDLDVLLGSPYPELIENDGSGGFNRLPNAISPTRNWHGYASFADLDGDGDLDFVNGNDGPNTLFLCVQRQIHLPLLPRVGTNFPLRVIAEPQRHPVGHLALLAASTRRAATPFPPFGVLRLDLAGAIPLSALLLPAMNGTGELLLTLSANPALQGLELTVQALLFDSQTTAAAFTNAVTVVVR